MKRLTLTFLFILSLTLVKAQQTAIATWEHARLEKALDKSNEHIQHDKKSQKPKTWFKRGELMQEIFEVNNIQFVRMDMPVNELLIYLGEPDEKRTITGEEGTKEEWIYEGLIVTVQNDLVKDWEETKFVTEKPLDKGYKAFMKTLELDEKGKFSKKVTDQLTVLAQQYLRAGSMDFDDNNYKEAYEDFHMVNVINTHDLINNPDTIMYFYAGLAAFEAEMLEESTNSLKKAIDLHIEEPRAYVYLKNIYLELGDTTKAGEIAQIGFERFPEENMLVLELINYYLQNDMSEKALEYIAVAKEQTPDNKTLYYVEGILHDKMGNYEKAGNAYQNAIDLDSQYFDAYYNYGVLYFNRAVAKFTEANETSDNEEYDRLRAEAKELLEKAIPFMEKAHEIKPDDRATLDVLKTLYYRTQKTEKVDEINRILEGLDAES